LTTSKGIVKITLVAPAVKPAMAIFQGSTGTFASPPFSICKQTRHDHLLKGMFNAIATVTVPPSTGCTPKNE
jgi:hypothetical protein